MALTWNSTSHPVRGYPAGSMIPTAPIVPAAPSIGSITSPNDLQLLVPITGVPAVADYVELWWSDTEAGEYVMHSAGPVSIFGVEVDAPNTAKWFKVRAVNSWGESEFSAAVSGTSSGVGAATPGQVQNLRVVAKTQTSITYAWDPLPGITSYTIQRWSGSNWTDHQVTGLTTELHAYTELIAGTEYGVRVRGVNSNAASPNGPFSGESWEFTEPSASAPVAGSIQVVANSQSQLTVSQVSAGSGWDQLSLRMSSSPSGPWTQVATSLPHSVSGLSAATTRYFQPVYTNSVSALSSEGAVVSATTEGESSGSEIALFGFEDGTLNGSQGGVILGSNNAGSGSSVTNSTAQAQSGSRSMAMQFRGGESGTDSWAEKRFQFSSPKTAFTMQWGMYVPSNFEHRNDSPNNNKLFRVWPAGSLPNNNYDSLEKIGASMMRNNANGLSRVQFEWNTGPGIGAKGNSYVNFITPSDKGQWMNVRVYSRAPTASQPARLKMWKNGLLILDESPANYDAGESHNFTFGYLLGWANSGFNVSTTIFVDNWRFWDGEVAP